MEHIHSDYSASAPVSSKYHVFHLIRKDKMWEIRQPSKNTPLASFSGPKEARKKIIELAQENRPSHVVIYNADGKICGSSLYP